MSGKQERDMKAAKIDAASLRRAGREKCEARGISFNNGFLKAHWTKQCRMPPGHWNLFLAGLKPISGILPYFEAIPALSGTQTSNLNQSPSSAQTAQQKEQINIYIYMTSLPAVHKSFATNSAVAGNLQVARMTSLPAVHKSFGQLHRNSACC